MRTVTLTQASSNASPPDPPRRSRQSKRLDPDAGSQARKANSLREDFKRLRAMMHGRRGFPRQAR